MKIHKRLNNTEKPYCRSARRPIPKERLKRYWKDVNCIGCWKKKRSDREKAAEVRRRVRKGL